jgi:hypothetical protein
MSDGAGDWLEVDAADPALVVAELVALEVFAAGSAFVQPPAPKTTATAPETATARVVKVFMWVVPPDRRRSG